MLSGNVFDIKRYAIHDGPGIRTTVFFKGCSLGCRWCHNPEGLSRQPELIFREERCIHCGDCIKICPHDALIKDGNSKVIVQEKCDLCGKCVEVCSVDALEIIGSEMTVQEVMSEIEKDIPFFDESEGGVTFSGGEPLNQPEFLNELLTCCKEKGIHTTVDTSGHCSYRTFELIRDKVDLFLYDIKAIDDQVHSFFTTTSNKTILENLKKLSSNGSNVIVRLPVIHGINDSNLNILEIADFLLTVPGISEINLIEYHKMAEAKVKRLNNPNIENTVFPENNSGINDIKDALEKYGFTVKVGG